MNYPENKKIQIVVINKKSKHNEHFEIIISVKPNKTVDEIIELIDLLIDQTEYGKVQVAISPLNFEFNSSEIISLEENDIEVS
jgi:hypothetical protein